jgi:hypothetical protein
MGKIACPKCGNSMSDKRTICEDCEAAGGGKEALPEKEAYEDKSEYTKKGSGDSYEKEEAPDDFKK